MSNFWSHHPTVGTYLRKRPLRMPFFPRNSQAHSHTSPCPCYFLSGSRSLQTCSWLEALQVSAYVNASDRLLVVTLQTGSITPQNQVAQSRNVHFELRGEMCSHEATTRLLRQGVLPDSLWNPASHFCKETVLAGGFKTLKLLAVWEAPARGHPVLSSSIRKAAFQMQIVHGGPSALPLNPVHSWLLKQTSCKENLQGESLCQNNTQSYLIKMNNLNTLKSDNGNIKSFHKNRKLAKWDQVLF